MNLAVRTEPLDHDHGHWCITCQLATGIRLIWAMGIGPALSLRTTLWCGGTNIHVDPEPRRCRDIT